MTKNEMNVYLCAILTTLAETGNAMPKSPIYLALGMDFDRYCTIEAVMVNAGLVTVTPETMTLTDAGHKMVAKIKAHIPGV